MEEVDRVLSELSTWSSDGESAVTKRFEFRDFARAFAFMTAVAIRAEHMDHHPEWSNVYRTVSVRLTTHDSGGVTQLDVDLARQMDEIAAGLGG